jgi:hypothetical protein
MCTPSQENGSEFPRTPVHGHGAEMLKADFAMPYSSWQRGCNLNGLVRQYIPNGCDIGMFTDSKSSSSRTSSTGGQGSDMASAHPSTSSSYPSNASHFVVELTGTSTATQNETPAGMHANFWNSPQVDL